MRKRERPAAIPSLRAFESGKRDSNPRPQPWQGCALPTELFPRRAAEYRPPVWAATSSRPLAEGVHCIPDTPRQKAGERRVTAVAAGATVGVHFLGGDAAI